MNNVFYEISEQNEVRAWIDGQEEPFMYQPHYPDGTPFETREQAEQWASAWYSHFTNPENAEFPISPEAGE